MSGPGDREIERLEDELCRDDLTEADRKEIRKAIREIARDMADEEAWRDEGHDRGWS